MQEELAIFTTAKIQSRSVLLILDYCKEKIDEFASFARRAMQRCMEYTGFVGLHLSNMLRSDCRYQSQVDDAVIKRLQKMKEDLQKKEAVMAMDPFQQTFLEKVRETTGSGLDSNRHFTIRTKLQVFADSRWCSPKVNAIIENCIGVSPGPSVIENRIDEISDEINDELPISVPKVYKPAEFKMVDAPAIKFDPTFLWLGTQNLSFEPAAKPSLSELFLSAQVFALEVEPSADADSSATCNFGSIEADDEFSMQLSKELLEPTIDSVQRDSVFVDDTEVLELLLAELSEQPLGDWPAFDTDGSFSRSA